MSEGSSEALRHSFTEKEQMKHFFITYKAGPRNDILKKSVCANCAIEALMSIGWPNAQVFSLYEYLESNEIQKAIDAAPSGEILDFNAWEKKYGKANSPEFLWVEPKTTPGSKSHHPMTNGRYVIRICARTGHVRFPSAGEYYGSWICPEITSAHHHIQVLTSASSA
jgi:hypothetical protein